MLCVLVWAVPPWYYLMMFLILYHAFFQKALRGLAQQMIMSTVLLVLVRPCPEGLSLSQGLELGVTVENQPCGCQKVERPHRWEPTIPGLLWGSRKPWKVKQASLYRRSRDWVLVLSPADGYVTQACFNPQGQRSLPLPICSTKSCISASCRLCWRLWVGWWVGAFL